MSWDAVKLEYNQKRKYEPVEMCSQEAVTVSLPESQPHEYDGWGGNADVQALGKFLASDEANKPRKTGPLAETKENGWTKNYDEHLDMRPLLAETDADRRWDKENITPIPCKEELQNVAKPFKRRKLPWAFRLRIGRSCLILTMKRGPYIYIKREGVMCMLYIYIYIYIYINHHSYPQGAIYS